MRRIMAVLLFIIISSTAIAIVNAESWLTAGKGSFEDILSYYDGKEITLSDQLQIIQDNVNYRKTPGGDVLGRLQGDFEEKNYSRHFPNNKEFQMVVIFLLG